MGASDHDDELRTARERAKLPVLDNIRIASRCRADWAQMPGDERVRTCAACSKQVFNLSSLTRADAEALIQRLNGELCARYYARKDGTILLADCTVGGAGARAGKLAAAGAAVALAGGALAMVADRQTSPAVPATAVPAPVPGTPEDVDVGRIASAEREPRFDVELLARQARRAISAATRESLRRRLNKLGIGIDSEPLMGEVRFSPTDDE